MAAIFMTQGSLKKKQNNTKNNKQTNKEKHMNRQKNPRE